MVDRVGRCGLQLLVDAEGFSIGSNDLTQLTLGVDLDSEIVAFDYDERDAGAKEMIRLGVEGCRRNGIHSGLCGQAPSDYPDMAEYLVRVGLARWAIVPLDLSPMPGVLLARAAPRALPGTPASLFAHRLGC